MKETLSFEEIQEKAGLLLSKKEEEPLRKSLQELIDFTSVLKKEVISPPSKAPSCDFDLLRTDEVKKSIPRASLLQNGCFTEDGYFVLEKLTTTSNKEV